MSELKLTTYSSYICKTSYLSVFQEVCQELHDSRHMIAQVFLRDLKAAYRKSYLGYLWAVIPGLTTTAIWMFLNSQNIINVGETDLPYPIYVLVGSNLWLIFTQAINAPMNGFNNGAGIFTKLKVSPLAFILAHLGSVFFDLIIKVALMIPLCILFSVYPPLSSLYLFPIGILGILAFGLGVGILLIPLGSLYGDVMRMVGFSLNFLMYLTPVVYPMPKDGWASILVHLNPATYLLGTTRDWLSTGNSQTFFPFLMVSLAGIFLLFIGTIILKIIMPHLVARMGM